MRIRRTLAYLVLAAAVASLLWARAEGPLRDPEAALQDFLKGEGRAEDQLTDPLVLAGRRVQPFVIQAVSDPSMPKRRYALSYLGCSRVQDALPVLREILENEHEQDHFRAGALEAIWLISRSEGVARAQSLAHGESGLLGQVASAIRAESWSSYCRSWIDAFFHVHH